MDQPTTSSATNSAEEGDQGEGEKINLENIGSITTKTLKRMIWKLQQDVKPTERTKNIPLSKPVARTARYTGINTVNVEKILAFGEFIKFEHAVIIDRHIIQKALVRMYVSQNHIPTITELFHHLSYAFPIYFDIHLFTKILIEMGYAFYKFPGNIGLRVMEKKSVMFERYKYLKSVQQYRNDKVPIVYFGLVSLNRWTNVLNLEKTLQADHKDILYHILFTATGESIDNVIIVPALPYDRLRKCVNDWLLEMFTLQNLPPGIVCVLEDSKIFGQTYIDIPTWKSVKTDMFDWLEEHNIPCHIDMPKAVLLDLIETCTDTEKNTFVLDNLIEKNNYSLLRLPQSINGLSIAALVTRYLNDKHCFKDVNPRPSNVNHIMSKISTVDLKLFSNIVRAEEKQQFWDDIKVDSILDELVRNMKKKTDVVENEDDLTLPTYSDSE